MTKRLRRVLERVLEQWTECWCKRSINYVCPACTVRRELNAELEKK